MAEIVWLTRDNESGVISDIVEVWLDKPSPTCNEGVVIWFHGNGPSIRLTAVDAALKYRTIPDHELQCIRIG